MDKKIRDVFVPFHYTPRTLYSAVVLIWLVAAGLLWLTAPVLIPSPLEVLRRLWEFLTDGEFYEEVFSSVLLTVTGMGASILLACLLAYISRIALFKPVADFSVKVRYMSMAGFMFAFTILLGGNAEHVKLAILMLGIVPFFTLSLVGVLDKIEPKEYDLWTTLRYNRWERLWQVAIRGKADSVIEAIRANFAMAWIMIIMVESYSMAGGGIGVYLFKASGKTQVDKVFALQLVILFLGVCFDYFLRYLRYLLFPHTALAEKN